MFRATEIPFGGTTAWTTDPLVSGAKISTLTSYSCCGGDYAHSLYLDRGLSFETLAGIPISFRRHPAHATEGRSSKPEGPSTAVVVSEHDTCGHQYVAFPVQGPLSGGYQTSSIVGFLCLCDVAAWLEIALPHSGHRFPLSVFLIGTNSLVTPTSLLQPK